jgi:hypothetical protein
MVPRIVPRRRMQCLRPWQLRALSLKVALRAAGPGLDVRIAIDTFPVSCL